MKRIRNERRKNTEDYRLEKLILEKTENSHESEEEKDIKMSPENKITTIKRYHKGSVSKPLIEDSEDESPTPKKILNSLFYNDCRVSENVSRLIDEKRSTIKEQAEDEEEFTGSSLNISGNFHLIRSSKNFTNKRESRSTVGGQVEDSERCSKNSKRKYSDSKLK